MKHRILRLAAAWAIVAAAGGLHSARADAVSDSGTAPVVVELFTSQGCSSCPPADAHLAELAARDDVIALSFHVDYWNRLGWRDPFATAWNTQRQREYRERLGLRYVYTPQMVVDGVAEAVGSDRGAIQRILGERRRDGAPHPRVTLARLDGDHARLSLPETAGVDARLILFGYDIRHRTEVGAGENAGRNLTNTNVVMVMEDWGRWSGAAVDRVAALPEPRPDRGYALLVVERGDQLAGRVLGAAKLPPSG